MENISLRCGGFLKQLSLRGCKSVTDGALRTIAQNCNNMEDLNLNDCKFLTDRSVESDQNSSIYSLELFVCWLLTLFLILHPTVALVPALANTVQD